MATYFSPSLYYILQLPEQHRIDDSEHDSEHPAEGQQQWRGRDPGVDRVPAGRRHAGQAAARLRALRRAAAAAEDGHPAAHEHLPAAGDRPHAAHHHPGAPHPRRPQARHRRNYHHEREPAGRPRLHVRRQGARCMAQGVCKNCFFNGHRQQH